MRHLPRYAVPHVYLKEFTTTKSEKKKNKYRIPDESYRIEDPSESTSPSKNNDYSLEEFKVECKLLYQKDSKKVSLSSFKIIKKIGKGSFGIIYLVEMVENGKIYALKQLRKDLLIETDALVCAKLEKEVLKRARHPFLVGLNYVFQTSVNIYFVMKFYRGGELYKHLQTKKRFSEDMVKFYGAQIALALGELHRNNIIYRDMKPENILMDVDGYIALADYGLAKIIDDKKLTTTFCGTPEYLAPEMVSEAGHNKQVDWWGLGVLIYEMIVGIPPFRNRNHHVLFQFISTKEVVFPPEKYKIFVSDEAKDLILKLLKKKPSERLGFKNDVKEVMDHPFFKSIDVEKLLKKEIVPEYKPPVNENDKYDLQNFGPVTESKEEPIETVDQKTMEAIKKNEVIFFIIYRNSFLISFNQLLRFKLHTH